MATGQENRDNQQSGDDAGRGRRAERRRLGLPQGRRRRHGRRRHGAGPPLPGFGQGAGDRLRRPAQERYSRNRWSTWPIPCASRAAASRTGRASGRSSRAPPEASSSSPTTSASAASATCSAMSKGSCGGGRPWPRSPPWRRVFCVARFVKASVAARAGGSHESARRASGLPAAGRLDRGRPCRLTRPDGRVSGRI